MWIKTYQNILVNLDNVDLITIRARDDKNMELCEIAAYYNNSNCVVINEFNSLKEAKEELKGLNKMLFEFK